MPTWDPNRRLRPEQVADVVAGACFTPGGAGTDQVGVEAEFFPVARDPAGSTRRLRLGEVMARTAALAEDSPAVMAAERLPAGDLRHGLAGGGHLTFEPGGQLEVSGRCHDTAASALDDLQEHSERLAAAFAADGALLLSSGVDVWHDEGTAPQQLTAARYPAMAAYLAERSRWGAVMMCHTASLQINLDLAVGTIAEERWEAVNLVAPLTVATFACSPEAEGPRRTSRRAQAWRELDPTRTGVPAGFEAGEGAAAVMCRSALAADVLLVRRAVHDACTGAPGWSFGSWLTDAHPRYGWPTADDLEYHLTTLFHEVRPRGAVEIRGVDALPARWRPVPVTLFVGLLYDRRARQQALEILRSERGSLTAALERAGREGLRDPRLCARAVEVWCYALEGARRLPPGYVRPGDLDRTEAFIDRFTVRGRSPTDELREMLAVGPEAALRWAAEPVPTPVL